MPKAIAVYLETGSKRTFAGALEWPGWCRSAKDEAGAIETLARYAVRYRIVAATAGLRFPAGAGSDFDVVERVKGGATTDFGAPGAIPEADYEPMTAAEARRRASIVAAAWTVLDRVVAAAPPVLRKGPRGGGRDRDQVLQHVLAAEASYARKIGVRHREPTLGDDAAIAALRTDIGELLRAARAFKTGEKGWPARYAARRIAWHVIDHAWEIEDKSES